MESNFNGATTLTFTNLPTGNKVKVVELMIDGAEPLTFSRCYYFDPDADIMMVQSSIDTP